MGLSVIGSGFGRTGTRSMKDALEQLGFGPCHHMEEVFAVPPQVPYWQAAAAGETVDWHDVFAGYKSQVDWPGCHYWRELAAAFPDAKVIHTTRPDEAWWSSFSHTIGKLMLHTKEMPLPPHIQAMFGAMAKTIGVDTFDNQWTVKDKALAAFHRRAEAVQAAIPPDRLLVFDVAEGWEPLCKFLGVAVPSTPFPSRNVKSDFWANLGGEPA